MHNLATLYGKQGKYVQSEPLLREALNGFEQSNNDGWLRYSCQSLLGDSLAKQKRYSDAEPLLLSGYNGMVQRQTSIPAAIRSTRLGQAGEWTIQLYRDWGRPEKVDEWTNKLQASTVKK